MIQSDKPILTRLLPIELTNGNDGRGHKFWSSAKVRQQIETDLRLLRETREPFDFPVSLRITRVVGKGQRKWDSDSVLRGNAKELIDALVAVGWFHDDGPKWITHTEGRQDDSRRGDGPTTLIEVFRE